MQESGLEATGVLMRSLVLRCLSWLPCLFLWSPHAGCIVCVHLCGVSLQWEGVGGGMASPFSRWPSGRDESSDWACMQTTQLVLCKHLGP